MLTELSMVYALPYILAAFLFLYEYRCTRRTFIIATAAGVSAMALVTFYIMFRYGLSTAGQLVALTCSIPSLILFWVLAKNRGARFLFTFCLVDTMGLWVGMTTAFLDAVTGRTEIVLFVLRLILYPLMDFAVWRWMRKPFLELQHTIRQGWGLFAAMTAVIYAFMLALTQFPTLLWEPERSAYLPHAFLFILLFPLICGTAFAALWSQKTVADEREKNAALEMKSQLAVQNLRQVQKSSEELARLRHDVLGQFTTLENLGRAGEYDRMLSCLEEYTRSARSIAPVKASAHPVVNAVLAYALDRAEREGAELTWKLNVPESLPISDRDLSVFLMNLLDNAFDAAAQRERESRQVQLTMHMKGQYLYINVKNPAPIPLELGEDAVPPSSTKGEGHGWGIKIMQDIALRYDSEFQFANSAGTVSAGAALYMAET